MSDLVYYNPSVGIQNLAPALEDETFLFFLTAYYDWMQTTDILYNGASGSFSNGEIITGEDSRATATVRYVDTNTIVVSMKTDSPFELGEEIVGGTSSASAFVFELNDNVLRKASRIRDNKNVEKVQGQFLELLKEEFNSGIPNKSEADRRKLISQLKDFFKSKSTEEAYQFIFKVLFNETIQIRYPGNDILRISDGKFLKQSTIRIGEDSAFRLAGIASVTSGNTLVVGINTNFSSQLSANDPFRVGSQQRVVSSVVNATHMFATTNFSTTSNTQFIDKLIPTDIFNFENKTIRGRTSGSIAVVSDIRASVLGGEQYADVLLRLISGSFEANEVIEDVELPSSNTIIYGILSTINIVDGGTGYSVDDSVVITGDGSEAIARVTSISEAPISKILLANTGIGYQNNIEATVNNSGTGGSGFRVKVNDIANTYNVGANGIFTVGDVESISIINRGSGYRALPTITLQDSSVTSLGMLHEKLIRINTAGTSYGVGDNLIFTGGSGSGAVGRIASVVSSNTILFESGIGILLEQSYYDTIKNEDWPAVGPIKRIELSHANGEVSFGSGYTTNSLPTITITSANGTSASLEAFNIQGKSAVVQIDSSNNIAGIGSIREVTIIDQGINYTTATLDVSGSGDGNANLTSEISGLFVSSGIFKNDDGKINTKIIQDSLFYQDFSYVVRSGLSFNTYKDIIKEIIHPAGLEFFGEIVITSSISVLPNFLSEITSAKAPLFVKIFSFLSLFEGINFPPTTEQSIIVRIKPFVSSFDNSKLDIHREINLEIGPKLNAEVIVYDTKTVGTFLDLELNKLTVSANPTATEQPRELEIIVAGRVQTYGDALISALETTPLLDYSLVQFGHTAPKDFARLKTFVEFIHRQIDLKIEPSVISQEVVVYETTTVGTFLDLELNTLDVASQLINQINIGIDPIVINLASTQFNSIELELDLELFIDVSASTHTEYNPQIIPSIDIGIYGSSSVEVIAFSVQPSELELALYTDVGIVLSTHAIQRIEFGTLKTVETLFTSNYAVLLDPLQNVTAIEQTQSVLKELPFDNLTLTSAFKQESNPNYGEVRIGNNFNFTPILNLANVAFDSFFGLDGVNKNFKSQGVVNVSGNTVSGTNTQFNIEFLQNDVIIIGNEKFIIKTIANSQFIELNVSAATNYINASAYREFFV